jgi:polyhydroxyalkanoate synthesis repressor PhaR
MRLIKRYSNRKLYDTATRTYITLEGIEALVQEGAEIKVVDNDTDEDLTTVILSQLLLERARSRRSPSSGLLSGLLRSGETLGRGLSNLARPLPLGSGGLKGMLEHEIERSMKFWLEIGQGSEEEVLRLIEGLVENRRRAKAPPEQSRNSPPGPGLLRRRGMDDFEDWDETRPASVPMVSSSAAELSGQAARLAKRATRLSQILRQNPPDPATARQLQAEMEAINRRLDQLEVDEEA